MARHFRTRSIKSNKSYTVDELADTTGASIPTVRSLIAAGMQTVDGNRPTIIMGFQALEYLNGRKANARRPLAMGEFYCLRCKAPRAAFGAMVDYVPSSESGGRLKGLCEFCECQCNRNISAKDLPEFRKVLDVATKAVGDPRGTLRTPLKSQLREGR